MSRPAARSITVPPSLLNAMANDARVRSDGLKNTIASGRALERRPVALGLHLARLRDDVADLLRREGVERDDVAAVDHAREGTRKGLRGGTRVGPFGRGTRRSRTGPGMGTPRAAL